MKVHSTASAVKNRTGQLPLLISTGAALCLFLSRSLLTLALIGLVFSAAVFAAGRAWTKPIVFHKLPSVMGAILLAAAGYRNFFSVWTTSQTVAALAEAVGLTTPALVALVGLLGCIAGFYAMLTLSGWAINWACSWLKENVPEQRPERIAANLKKNWLLPISATAFFLLSANDYPGYYVGVILAFFLYLLIASQTDRLWSGLKEDSLAVTVLHCLTAAGICLGCQQCFQENPQVPWQNTLPPAQSQSVFRIISILGAIVSAPFLYAWVRLFWKKLGEVLAGAKPDCPVKKSERAIYAIVMLAALVMTVTVFSRSYAFYGPDALYDTIYTSDPSDLYQYNIYLLAAHPENDLRQPLFAVFAAPFIAIPYLIGMVLRASPSIHAMLQNSVQIVMLFAANFMLASLMELSPGKRICFILLNCFTYTFLLFSVMMEQYIVAYFWLVLCIYLICRKQPCRMALWGAGGTLLTSLALLPSLSEKSPFRDFKGWVLDAVKHGLGFAALLLAFCRFDVLYNLASRVLFFSNFTGKSLPWSEKIAQYTVFVKNCLLAPDAGIHASAFNPVSWQLDDPAGISALGVLILALCMVSAWINREKKISRFAAGWIGFSVVVLLILGWGTIENGLILYSLYFGWAFLVLLFQLVEKAADKLKPGFLLPGIAAVWAAVLAAINIPAFLEMVRFAIAYYPA